MNFVAKVKKIYNNNLTPQTDDFLQVPVPTTENADNLRAWSAKD